MNTVDCPSPHSAVLPPLYCPYESALHEQAEVVETSTLAWADRFGLADDPAVRRRLGAMRGAWLSGRVTPRATLPGLLVGTDWQTWLFLFDDAYCDESDRGRRCADTVKTATHAALVLDGGRAPGQEANPFLTALADVRDRLSAMTSPEQFARFTAQVESYLLAQTWEAAHREQGTLAGFAEYVTMRRRSGGVPTCLALIEAVNGFELPGAVWSSPRLRALSDAVVDIVCWANDILSYPKEASRSTQVLSLPAVLCHERGLSIGEALALAARLHDERVEEYQRLEEPLLRDGGEEVRRYLADLRHWIAGNLAWSLETGRYGLGVVA
ncbi:hypothetical protein KGA66_00925 [Actinocrinis puniceicyclus]|uniref:Terpene synthase n=1 Tax=Actinocrinis puniceicyclus TaxID=977794 RepID=A0A8J7WKQ0_9ACTN|nr:hypothetical protein [Actinocrinis puniceicyclus]MBS2961589.1 hypothetical protein [Actinocrinis puniceicyclus]